VLRIEMPGGGATAEAEYGARTWQGPIDDAGLPDLDAVRQNRPPVL
jgi:hypothetical protein